MTCYLVYKVTKAPCSDEDPGIVPLRDDDNAGTQPMLSSSCTGFTEPPRGEAAVTTPRSDNNTGTEPPRNDNAGPETPCDDDATPKSLRDDDDAGTRPPPRQLTGPRASARRQQHRPRA